MIGPKFVWIHLYHAFVTILHLKNVSLDGDMLSGTDYWYNTPTTSSMHNGMFA